VNETADEYEQFSSLRHVVQGRSFHRHVRFCEMSISSDDALSVYFFHGQSLRHGEREEINVVGLRISHVG
jgi:hypothetical protein